MMRKYEYIQMRSLFHKYWDTKKMFFFIVIFLFSSLFSLVFPYLFSNVIGLYTNDKLSSNLFRIVLILLSQLFLMMLSEIYSYWKTIYAYKIDFKMKIDFMEQIQKKTVDFSENKLSGELQHRMFSDISTITNIFFVFIVELPVLLLLLIITIIIISKISVFFTFLSIIMMLLLLAQVRFFQPSLKKAMNEFKNTNQSIIGEVNEHFSQLELISLFNLENLSLFRFNSKLKKLFKTLRHQIFITTIGGALSNVIFQFWISGIFLLAVVLLSNKSITLAEFALVFAYASIVPQLWQLLITIIWKYQDFSVSFERYREYYDFKTDDSEKNTIERINTIEFNKVKKFFSGKEGLQEYSFSFCLDKVVLLTGKNGSGKSTIIKLLLKEINNYDGNIYINKKNIKDISANSIRSVCSVATQTPYLIKGSILDNLLISKSDISTSRFKKISSVFELNDLMKKLEVTIDTDLHEESILLSGGEKQKINLLRALLKESQFVILDEPFRNLDRATIDRLTNYIKHDCVRRGYLIITHDNIGDFSNSISFKINLDEYNSSAK